MKTKSEQSGGSPLCRICTSGSVESISHVISSCQAMSTERDKILNEFRILCSLTKNCINFEDMLSDEETLCQFLLDPTSLNLSTRVSLNDPLVQAFFKLSRDFCYKIDKTRIGLLRQLEHNPR